MMHACDDRQEGGAALVREEGLSGCLIWPGLVIKHLSVAISR